MLAVTALAATMLTAPLSPAVSPSRLEQAIETQRELLAQSPRDIQLLNDLGNLLAAAGRLEEAEKIYRETLGLDPQRVSTRFNLALLLQQRGRRSEAKEAYEAILKFDPDHAWSHYQLGRLLEDAGRRRQAIQHYARAFRLDPRLTLAEFNPHIIDNRLATESLLEAYSGGSASDLTPRQYQDPERIRELLMPEASELDEESPYAGESASDRHQGISGSRARWEQEPPVQDPAATEEPGPAAQAVPSEETGAIEAEAPRQPASDRGGEGPAPAAYPAVVGPIRQPSESDQGAAGSPRTEQEQPPVPRPTRGRRPGTPPESPPSSSEAPRFVPGVFSTGRLEPRLIPASPDRIASLAGEPAKRP